MSQKDYIPHNLQISYYHTVLVHFLDTYSEPSLITNLSEWVSNRQIMNIISSKKFNQQSIQVAWKQPEMKFDDDQNRIIGTLNRYGVNIKHIYSSILNLIDILQVNGSIKINKILVLFLTNPRDVALLKLVNYDLFQLRQNIVDTWTNSSM